MLNLLQSSFPTLAELLSPELMADIRRQGKEVRYGDGELVQMRGEAPTGFSIIDSGQIIAGSEGMDGSFFTAGLLNPGDHFGEVALFAGLPRLQNLRALGKTELLHIPAAKFFEVFNREPDIGRALLTISLRRIHFMMEFIDGQRRWPLPVRIAHLLVTSVEDRNRIRRHAIHCRHEDLAEMLGVSRVAISKALSSLQAEGLLAMRYGGVELNDVQDVLEWLDANYQVSPIQPDAEWRF